MHFFSNFATKISFIKTTKHIIAILLWVIISIYTVIIVLLHIPAIQDSCGDFLEQEVGKKIGAKVAVGRISVGLLNRITVDEIAIADQEKKEMLACHRLSAKIDVVELLKGRIEITSAQVFGLRATLSRKSAESSLNCQFLIDSLSSKDSEKGNSLSLQITSLVVRNSSVRYDVLNEKRKERFLDVNHLYVNNISGHIVINSLTNESLTARIKKFSFKEEHSGFSLNHLSLTFNNTEQKTEVKDFALRTENSDISLDIAVNHKGKEITSFEAVSRHSAIGSRDLSCFLPNLPNENKSIFIDAEMGGDKRSCFCKELTIRSAAKDFLLSLQGQSDSDINKLLKAPLESDWRVKVNSLNAKGDFLSFLSKTLNAKGIKLQNLGDINYTAEAISKNRAILFKGKISSQIGDCQHSISYSNKTLTTDIITSTLKIGRVLNDNTLGDCELNIYSEVELNESLKKAENATVKIEAPLLTIKSYPYRNLSASIALGPRKAFAELSLQDLNANVLLKAEAASRGAFSFDQVERYQAGQGCLKKGRGVNVGSRDRGVDAGSRGVDAGNAFFQNIVVDCDVSHLNLEALNLSERYASTTFSGMLHAECWNIEDLLHNTSLEVSDFSICDSLGVTSSNRISATAFRDSRGEQRITLSSDFADIDVTGRFDVSTLSHSLMNLFASKLPTITGLEYHHDVHNRIRVDGIVRHSGVISKLAKIDLETRSPLSIYANIDDDMKMAEIRIENDSVLLGGSSLNDSRLHSVLVRDTLDVQFSTVRNNDDGGKTVISLNGMVTENKLSSLFSFANKGKKEFSGTLHTESSFFKSEEGENISMIKVLPSTITMGDSLWHIHPSEIVHSPKRLSVKRFVVQHDSQHIIVDGKATQNLSDSLSVSLQDVDVAYIMNLINFHSVEFAGLATGKIVAKNLMQKPEAYADLDVRNFLFEEGRMGTLTVHASWDNEEGKIDIDGRCSDDDVVTKGFYAEGNGSLGSDLLKNDSSGNGSSGNGSSGSGLAAIGLDGETKIDGYVSIKKNYIDLDIRARNTRAEFMESFCSSFLDDVQVWANGRVRLWGDLSDVNLTGNLVANGTVHVTPLNTWYTLRNDSVELVIDDIRFKECPIYDMHGNKAILTGALHHDHLSRMTFDIGIEAQHLLCFDFPEFQGSTFCGHVIGSGTCMIRGRAGEIVFDIDARPEKGTEIAYNVASPDAIQNQEFITWKKCESEQEAADWKQEHYYLSEFRSNIRLNFLIHATPESTLRLLMDEKTGDYITLNGNGTLRASYYNKGGLQIFGNYNVVDGEYKMTIQKVIKKSFEFLPGGTIVFGGEPFESAINLQAQYVLPSVPLSDLNIGNSFKNNNVKVNCLMNITGTAEHPQVDFDLNIPQASADVQKMITAAMDTEQRRMQQVVYLLSVGRFYAAEDAAKGAEQSQASLAMQSFLSGTLSQQINNVISDALLKNRNWNFGANISPGDEGMMNAEYEGLISGSMLNNRLLVNGQFGYRDNANATTSFIGDFDIRYLLFPNGNLLVRVYNQTSDRYFTKSNLNTQGIGIIFKHDFKDFLPWLFRKREKKN